jgi:preprotein translocase subunit SecG
MVTILTIIHILVCIFMVSIVLLQHGKGADIGATFGGGSQSLFGTEGPVPMLNKVTTAVAVIFMVTSITLAYLSAHRTTGSVMGDYSAPAPIEQQAPIAEKRSPCRLHLMRNRLLLSSRVNKAARRANKRLL